MITLRCFRAEDVDKLQKEQYSSMSPEEIRRMIDEWNKGEFQGKAFAMYAILDDGELAGEISLYQQSQSAVSIGPVVFPAFRRRSIGKGAMCLALEIAKKRGYRIASQQVRTDNASSIALHEGLGFETDGYRYTNRNGKEVFIYLKAL